MANMTVADVASKPLLGFKLDERIWTKPADAILDAVNGNAAPSVSPIVRISGIVSALG
ncbi:hypothetical protein [Methylobacterium sp. WSM2598]|uniref:hypothetical protein n=1 Tax=Methylobacterium sp. WSM2598 TaxID=398261 RepID=UPI0003AA5241|nr:hypothetical protein [Methylobacterium sp. WSM2598]